MIIRHLHEWGMSTREAMALQERLAPLVSRQDMHLLDVRHIAGVDVSAPFGKYGEGVAAVVVLNYPDLLPVEVQTARGLVDFPYVPGLLSFRELPLVVRAFENLTITPDLVIVDGQGVAHPRRFGIAAHLGLILDLPTIGCAKSWLTGEHTDPGTTAGGYVELVDRGEVIGAVLRTRDNVRPVYVSVGHRVSLAQAIRWVLACCRGYRLPDPTRLAHQAAGGYLRRDPVAELT